jgi:hypothetical protein
MLYAPSSQKSPARPIDVCRQTDGCVCPMSWLGMTTGTNASDLAFSVTYLSKKNSLIGYLFSVTGKIFILNSSD